MRIELWIVIAFLFFVAFIVLYNISYEESSKDPKKKMRIDKYLREPGSRENIIDDLSKIMPQKSLLGLAFNKQVLSKSDYRKYKHLKILLERQNLLLKNDFIQEISMITDSDLLNVNTKSLIYSKFEVLYNRYLNEVERKRMSELDIFKLNEYLKFIKRINELEKVKM